jgi:hypothetical protein
MSAMRLLVAVGRACAAREKERARAERERKLAPRWAPLPQTIQGIELELSDLSLPADGLEVPRAREVLWAIQARDGQVDLKDAQRALSIIRQRAAQMVA